jgi:hypothetical protein
MFIMTHLYFYAVMFIKLAILLEWLRIFVPQGTRNFMFWTIHFLMVACIIYYPSASIAFNVACEPHEYWWNKLIDGSCHRVNTRLINIVTSIFSLITDVLILLLPQKVIWKLQMPTRRKINISIVFALGVLACASALARIIVAGIHAVSKDYSYSNSALMFCSYAEVICGFLVACVPGFAKILSKEHLRRQGCLSGFRRISERTRSTRTRDDTNGLWKKASQEPSETIIEYQPVPLAKLQYPASTWQREHVAVACVEKGYTRSTHVELSTRTSRGT